jgi:hypothetical protein
MISSASPSLARTPSFWLTVLCIWISGWASSAASSVWLPYRIVGTGLGFSVVQAFAGAFIGALVLRAVLPRLANVSISYPWAVIALGLGALAGNSLTFALQTFTVRHAPAAAAPMIWSSPLLAFAAMAVSFLVSYQVIAIAGAGARSSKPASTSGAVQAPADDWYHLPAAANPAANATGPSLGDVVAHTQHAVAQTCIDVSRSTGEQMAGHVVDALTELGTCVRSLEHAASSDPKVRAETDRLVEGLNRFQTALTQIAADAAASASQRMYQPGALFGSMADVSDGGGLARYELDHADGLAAVRESFERLRALGILREPS